MGKRLGCGVIRSSPNSKKSKTHILSPQKNLVARESSCNTSPLSYKLNWVVSRMEKMLKPQTMQLNRRRQNINPTDSYNDFKLERPGDGE